MWVPHSEFNKFLHTVHVHDHLNISGVQIYVVILAA